MVQILIVFAVMLFSGVVAPFLVFSFCVFIENQQEKTRTLKRVQLIEVVDEILAATIFGLICEGFSGRFRDFSDKSCDILMDKGLCDTCTKNFCGTDKDKRIFGDSMLTALKSLVVYQLKPSHIRFIKKEYKSCDKWVLGRIRIFLEANKLL